MRALSPYLGVAALLSAGALGVPFGAQATRSADVAACAPQVHDGVLPVWMRGGFGPEPRTTYVLGRRRVIGAVLWGARALDSPPAQQRNNNILWGPRNLSKSVAALWIKMQKMDGTQTVGSPVRRTIKTGPGPSIVDAPSAGCWRFTLTWSGRRDTLDLSYVPPTN